MKAKKARNYVAKNGHVNRAQTHKDKKNDYTRKNEKSRLTSGIFLPA